MNHKEEAVDYEGHVSQKLTIKPVRVKKDNGQRTMYFKPNELHEMIHNNPDGLITIVGDDGYERTFDAKPIWEVLFANQRL